MLVQRTSQQLPTRMLDLQARPRKVWIDVAQSRGRKQGSTVRRRHSKLQRLRRWDIVRANPWQDQLAAEEA